MIPKVAYRRFSSGEVVEPVVIPGRVTDLTITVLSDTELLLVFTTVSDASVYEYTINGSGWTALESNRVITGLTASTAYNIQLRGISLLGVQGLPSNTATATTNAGVVVPSTIADLTGTVLGQTSVQLAFTDSVGASSHEVRVDGGSWFALAVNKIVLTTNGTTLLAAGTEYDFEVRGINAGGAGLASNLITKTTTASVGFDPLSLLSSSALSRVEAEYPGLVFNATAVWGPTGIPSYADPVYDTTGADIPADALDISNFGNNVATLLAAMEVQGKPGKIGSGTYTVLNLTTVGSRSLYGYEVAGGGRPIIKGTWYHYIVGSNVKFQYIKRTNNTSAGLALAPFWLICIDNHGSTFMTSSDYATSIVRPVLTAAPSGVVKHNTANVSGISMLDCEIDGVEYAFVSFFGSVTGGTANKGVRISNVRIGRNTYRNGCKAIAAVNAMQFGDGTLGSGNGVYIYQNDLLGPAFHNRRASWAGTVVAAGGAGVTNTALWNGITGRTLGLTNGPMHIEHNRMEDVVGTTLQTRDENNGTGIHVSQSFEIYIRYNLIVDIWSPFFTIEAQPVYGKSCWPGIRENYIVGGGSSTDNKRYSGGTQGGGGGYQDWNGTLPDSCGCEALIVLKGSGGWAADNVTIKRSEIIDNIIIPRFTNTPVYLPHHIGIARGNLVIGHRWSSYKRPGEGVFRCDTADNIFGPNERYVDCGHDTYAGKQTWLVNNGGGLPGTTFDNFAVDFDGGATPVLFGITNPAGATNRALTPLTVTSAVGKPWVYTEPKITLSGSDLLFATTWNETVTETYRWLRDGVAISGETTTTLPAAKVFGSIQCEVTATSVATSLVTKQVSDPWFELGANLLVDTSSIVVVTGAAATHDRVLSPVLEGGEEYLVTFRTTPVYLGGDAILTVHVVGGTVVPNVPVPLHITSYGGLWKYRYRGVAGDNILRITRPLKYTGTIDQIALQKILTRQVSGATSKFVTAGVNFTYEYTQAWTAVVACRVDSLPVEEGILFSNVTNATSQTGLKMFIGTDGKVRVRLGSSASARVRVSGSINVADGLLHVLGATYDGSGLASGVRLFVDGVEDTPVVQFDNLAAGSITGGLHEFYLLNEKNSLTRFLPGSIEAFSLSDVERSPYWMERRGKPWGVNLYHQSGSRFGPLGETDGDVVLAYDFNEGTGTALDDLSASGFNGTLSHPDMWSSV